MATPIKFTAQVSRVVPHTPDVVTYEFRYLDRRPRYKPGQFLHLALDSYDPSGHWPESRVFTIAKGMTDSEYIRLTIAKKGAFTSRIIDELEVGRKVWMKAPYGEFIVKTDPERETVLIAGGTGVTPFVAFMEDALVKGISGDVWLHYGAREKTLLVFRDLAAKCVDKFPSFHAEYYVEEETKTEEGLMPGRIDMVRLCNLLKDIKKSVFYLSGPQEMIEQLSNQLTTKFKVPKQKIRVDQWM